MNVRVHGWMNVVHTHRPTDLALDRDAVLIHATTWTHLEDIILNEISQTKTGKYCVPLFIGDT